VSELCRELNIVPLRSYGIGEEEVPTLVEAASRASSTKSNPIVLNNDGLREILIASLVDKVPSCW